MLVQIDGEGRARGLLKRSELAQEWLERAGIGAYPPLFVGRLRGMVRIDGTPDPNASDQP